MPALLWIRSITNPVHKSIERHVVEETACAYTFLPVYFSRKVMNLFCMEPIRTPILYIYMIYVCIYLARHITLLFGFQARPRHWSGFDLAFIVSLVPCMHECCLASCSLRHTYSFATLESVGLASILAKCVEQESPLAVLATWPIAIFNTNFEYI